jgi:hypothetical protein
MNQPYSKQDLVADVIGCVLTAILFLLLLIF